MAPAGHSDLGKREMRIFRVRHGTFGIRCAMDASMRPDLHDTINTLDDRETIICCRGLVVLMDHRMRCDPRSGRPRDLIVTDFHQWVRRGGPPVRALVGALCEGRPALAAEVGRRLMQTCLAWGAEDGVGAACRLVYAPVDSLGTLSPETVVAALAAVMLWHPARPSLETLLRPAPVRRFPWLHAPQGEDPSTPASAATPSRKDIPELSTLTEK